MPRATQKTTEPAAELIVPDSTTPALPGVAEADEELLNQAVAQINHLYIAKGLETARTIGEYVLETFFEGNPENFRASGNEHVSFRKLAEREDLHVSYTWIWRAVSVVDQLRQLPEDIGQSLPYTHHTLLLPVKDEKTKLKLAKKAATEGWPKRKLSEEVAKVRAKEKGDSKAGRPPLPRFEKSINKLSKFLEKPDEAFGDLEQLDELDAAKAQKLLQTVAGMRAQCEALEQRLQARITPE
jgi:hypothetical protein